MIFEDTKLLQLNQYKKSNKAPFFIYADLGYILKKDGCKNNPENPSTTEISETIPIYFSMSKLSSFKAWCINDGM